MGSLLAFAHDNARGVLYKILDILINYKPIFSSRIRTQLISCHNMSITCVMVEPITRNTATNN